MTPSRASELYLKTTETPTRKTGKPPAAGSHRFYLALVQGFYGWALRKGYVMMNPFKEVRPIRRASTGKAQLRLDQAKRYREAALRLFEVMGRRARDIDAGGSIIWIDRGKSKNARRHLSVNARPIRAGSSSAAISTMIILSIENGFQVRVTSSWMSPRTGLRRGHSLGVSRCIGIPCLGMSAVPEIIREIRAAGESSNPMRWTIIDRRMRSESMANVPSIHIRGPAPSGRYSYSDGCIDCQRSGRKRSGSGYRSGRWCVISGLRSTPAPLGSR